MDTDQYHYEVSPSNVLPARVPDGVFDQNTFQEALSACLSRAQRYVLIESAYVSIDGAKRFRKMFENAVARDVTVCAFVEAPQDLARMNDPNLDDAVLADLRRFVAAVDLLASFGIHVSLRPWTHLKLAVIDGRWVWGGTLNILSYTKWRDEEVYFWDEADWAKKTVKRRRLNECDGCAALARNIGMEGLMTMTPEQLANQIAELRKQAGLSQEELARLVNVDRKSIYNIEKGRMYPRADLLIRIYTATGRSFIAVPPELATTIRNWLCIHSE